MKKTVVIVEDDSRLQKQLALMLKGVPDIKCLYAVSSAEEALERIPLETPDIVLMDINLPKMSGIDCVALLKQRLPSLEIIMLTIYEDSDNIFKALKAGAIGYLNKSSHPEELSQSIRDAYNGGAPFSIHIARKVVRHFQAPPKTGPQGEKLSPRENEVLNLLASGYLYKEIADQLGIKPETVRGHVKSICLRMHVRNRTEAVAKFRP